MAEPVSLLMLQFLEWVAIRPRTYTEAMDGWRTSCPRLSVWEDAVFGGLIEVHRDGSKVAEVVLTPRGRAILQGNHPRGAVQTSQGIEAKPAAGLGNP